MKTNFLITDNYAFTFNSKLIDIHNNYDFEGYQYEVKENQLKLFFIRRNDDWVDRKEPFKLILNHKNIKEYIIENESEEFDRSVVEVTFFPSYEKFDDSLMVRIEPEENDDIIYIFESDQILRIVCKEVILETQT
jgi:hypothetical protein